MSLTPLQKHLKEQQKRRAKREILNKSLQESSGLAELPGEFIENISVAYRDLQTSLNNLDKATMRIRELSIGQPHQSQQGLASTKTSSQTSSTHQESDSISLQTNLSQPPSLSRVLRNLKNLETRQISTVRRYRKLFAILGFRQSFVDGLEGIVSVYSDDSDPAIDLNKNLGLMEDAQTE